MQFSEWEPIYERILADMGYDRESDENSVRILKAVTMVFTSTVVPSGLPEP